MIRLGQRIRLTQLEVERFTQITGFTPANVKSLDDLADYIAGCKRYYWGTSDETRFLHYLIDRELQAVLAGRSSEKASAPAPSTTVGSRLVVADGAGV